MGIEYVFVSKSCWKVLRIILRAADKGRSLSLREIGRYYNGNPKTSWVAHCVSRLEELGLLSRERVTHHRGDRRAPKSKPGTLRPTCRVTVYPQG